MGQKIKLGFVALLFVGMFAIAVPALFDSRGQPAPMRAEQAKAHSDIEAYTQAQEIIRKYLKSPATADFPTMANASIKSLQDDGWQISSYVDAQNSFGANLRSNWDVVFQYVGDSVEIHVVVLDGQALYTRASTEGQ